MTSGLNQRPVSGSVPGSVDGPTDLPGFRRQPRERGQTERARRHHSGRATAVCTTATISAPERKSPKEAPGLIAAAAAGPGPEQQDEHRDPYAGPRHRVRHQLVPLRPQHQPQTHSGEQPGGHQRPARPGPAGRAVRRWRSSAAMTRKLPSSCPGSTTSSIRTRTRGQLSRSGRAREDTPYAGPEDMRTKVHYPASHSGKSTGARVPLVPGTSR